MLPRTRFTTWRSRTLVAASLGVFGCQALYAAGEIAVVGPIDSVGCGAKSVTVLNIRFAVPKTLDSASVCSEAANQVILVVAAQGRVHSSGTIVLDELKVVSSDQYVAGATTIYVRGPVTASNATLGTLSIHGAIVATGSLPPPIGTNLEILASQPHPGGVLLPSLIALEDGNSSAGSRAVPFSSAGSGILSSAGSGAVSLSSAGSGRFSSAGSGKLSSAGSGAVSFSSAGSGKLSSAGSGAVSLSSAGSGRFSSAGSGKLSSAGSGAVSFSSAGSGKLSSAGSGAVSLSSAGSGRLSSAGSGKLSSAGSGAVSFSSAGSGKLSSAGSGAVSLSSAGSGRFSSAGSGLTARE
jgi:hypothetical protein